MKKLYAILFAIILCLPTTTVYATGYNMLVMPSGLVGATRKSILGTTDIEEALTIKLIKYLDENNITCSPTLSTLKLSIKNNANCVQNPKNVKNNINAVSKAYGVYKVLVISSKIEVQNATKQKSYWYKLDLPVITPLESNIKIITNVSLINTQTNETLWNNVFYKNINCIGNGINNYNSETSKLNAINNYYNTLATTIVDEIKANKDLKSIMVITKPNNNNKTYTLKPVSSNNVAPQKNQEPKVQTVHTNVSKPAETNIINMKNLNTVKPNLNMHETIKPKKDSVFKVIKNNIQLKYDNIKQEYENNQIKKMELNTTAPAYKKKDAQVIKEVPQTDKKQTQTTEKIQSPKTEKEVVKKEKETKKIDKPQKIKQEKVKKEPIQKQEKVEDKEKKPTFSEKIQTKYENVKKSYQEYKDNKAKDKKELEDNIDTIDDNAPKLDNCIKAQPRSNSRNYTPKFDSSVNDM